MAILYSKIASIGLLLATLLSSPESVESLAATPTGENRSGLMQHISQENYTSQWSLCNSFWKKHSI